MLDRLFQIHASSSGVLVFKDFSLFSKTLFGTRGSSSSHKTARCYRIKFLKGPLHLLFVSTVVLYHRSVAERKPRIFYDLTELNNVVNAQCREERQAPHAERTSIRLLRRCETQAKGIRRGIAQVSDRTLQAPGMGEDEGCASLRARCSGKKALRSRPLPREPMQRSILSITIHNSVVNIVRGTAFSSKPAAIHSRRATRPMDVPKSILKRAALVCLLTC